MNEANFGPKSLLNNPSIERERIKQSFQSEGGSPEPTHHNTLNPFPANVVECAGESKREDFSKKLAELWKSSQDSTQNTLENEQNNHEIISNDIQNLLNNNKFGVVELPDFTAEELEILSQEAGFEYISLEQFELKVSESHPESSKGLLLQEIIKQTDKNILAIPKEILNLIIPINNSLHPKSMFLKAILEGNLPKKIFINPVQKP